MTDEDIALAWLKARIQDLRELPPMWSQVVYCRLSFEPDDT